MNTKRTFLCVCAGGNVRSHALSYIFKSRGHLGIPIGTDHWDAETAKSLILDSHKICTVDRPQTLAVKNWIHQIASDFPLDVSSNIEKILLERVVELPLGPDRWGVNNCLNFELLNTCTRLINNAGLLEDSSLYPSTPGFLPTSS